MVNRILLIEANPTSQDIIASLLAGRGYRVDVASDSFSALECARTAAYDVILLDSQLPEVARHLTRQTMKHGPAPVLLGLTYDRAGPALTVEPDSVFTALLVKPIRPHQLFEAIDRVRATARTALPTPAPASEATPARRPERDAASDPRHATRALWQTHGLASHPKACICPSPSTDQIVALSLCFDIVDTASAELIVLVARDGLAEARRVAQTATGKGRPIVGLAGADAGVCDAIFEVSDPPSWRDVAILLTGATGILQQMPTDDISVPDQPTAADAAFYVADIAQHLARLRTMIDVLLQQIPSDAAGEQALLRATGGIADDITMIAGQVDRLIARHAGVAAQKVQ